MEIEKVCVRIPSNRKGELLTLVASWRAQAAEAGHRTPGWDAKIIHEIAGKKFGGLLGLYEHHGWEERGNKMMPTVQRHIKERYGSIERFMEEHGGA